VILRAAISSQFANASWFSSSPNDPSGLPYILQGVFSAPGSSNNFICSGIFLLCLGGVKFGMLAEGTGCASVDSSPDSSNGSFLVLSAVFEAILSENVVTACGEVQNRCDESMLIWTTVSRTRISCRAQDLQAQEEEKHISRGCVARAQARLCPGAVSWLYV
jgi:hypothetical protein